MAVTEKQGLKIPGSGTDHFVYTEDLTANINIASRQASYDPIYYGADKTGVADSRTAFANVLIAIATAGTNETIEVTTGTYKISSNITIPSTVTLDFQPGAKFSIDTGIVLTIVGGMNDCLSQRFSGLGTVSFTGNTKIKEIYPQWWGAVADGTTNDAPAIQACWNAGSVAIKAKLINGNHHIDTMLTLPPSYTHAGIIEGEGKGSIISTTHAITMIGGLAQKSYEHTIRDVRLDGGGVATIGINMQGMNASTIENVTIENVNGSGIYLFDDPADYLHTGCYGNRINNSVVNYCTTGIYCVTNSTMILVPNIAECTTGILLTGASNHVKGGFLYGDGDLNGINIVGSSYSSVMGIYFQSYINGIIEDSSSTQNEIHNNHFEGCTTNRSTLGYISDYGIDGVYTSQNLVPNSNFGTWLTATTPDRWVFSGTDGTATITPSIEPNNSYADLRIAPVTTNRFAVLTQSLVVQIPKQRLLEKTSNTVTLVVKLKRYTTVTSTSTSLNFRQYLYCYDKNGKILDTKLPGIVYWGNTLGEESDWYTSTHTWSIPTGTIYFGLELQVFNTTDTTVRGGAKIGYVGVTTGVMNFQSKNDGLTDMVKRTTGAPTVGTYKVGQMAMESTPTAGGICEYVCTTAGTLGTLSGVTADTVSGRVILIPNTLTGLAIGQHITIAGVAGIKEIYEMPAALGSTTVNNTSNSGQAVVAVASVTNFVAGEYVVIGRGTARVEYGRILTVGTTSITMTANLTYTHTAAEADGFENAVLVTVATDATVNDGAVAYSAPVFSHIRSGIQQTGFAVLKTNYTSGDLDSEAEIISALNTTNTALNAVRTALNALGLTTTV